MPPLPPLYKYLDVNGARLTLRNRTFKHAKPSDFNDTEDLTIQSIFPESEESALAEIKNNFNDVLLQNLNESPTCINPKMRSQIALIQAAYRNNPKAAEEVRKTLQADLVSGLYDLERIKRTTGEFIRELNELLQRSRVLCVSKLNNSKRMWCRYADRHRGVVLRISPNLGKDSKYSLFRPVVYRKTRPPLYDNVLDFIRGSMFGDQEKQKRELIEKIIFSKTLEWEYEAEYRFAIPVFGSEDWNTLAFHPEEITELYLGSEIEDGFRNEIISLIEKINPDAKIYQAILGEKDDIKIEQWPGEIGNR